MRWLAASVARAAAVCWDCGQRSEGTGSGLAAALTCLLVWISSERKKIN